MDEVKINKPKLIYPKEKISQLIEQIEKDISEGKNIFKTIRSKIYEITIQDAITLDENLKSILNQIKEAIFDLENKLDKYWKVVKILYQDDNYDLDDKYYDLVTDLDYKVTDLSNVNDDLDDLEDIVNNIIESVEKLKGQFFTK